jgi:hypothetical protein
MFWAYCEHTAWLSPQMPQMRLVMKCESRRVLALHEHAVAAEDRDVLLQETTSFGEVDLRVDAEVADDPRDRIPRHVDDVALPAAGVMRSRVAHDSGPPLLPHRGSYAVVSRRGCGATSSPFMVCW